MGAIEQKTYQTSVNVTMYTIEELEQLMAAILRYLKDKDKNAGAKALAKEIKNGTAKEVICYGDTSSYRDLLKALKDEGIYALGHIGYDGKMRFTAGALNAERILEINRAILLSQCNYIHAADLTDFENAIAQYGKNKELVKFENIDNDFAFVLNNKLNRLYTVSNGETIHNSKPITVGIRENENTTTISLSDKYVINLEKRQIENGKNNKEIYNKDLCRCILDSAVSLYGQNSEIKHAEIEFDKKAESEIESALRENKELWIVTAENQKDAIHISPDGVDIWDLNGKKHYDKDDPNIDDIILEKHNQMYSESIVDTVQALSWMQGFYDKCPGDVRNARDDNKKKISDAEKEMVKNLDHIIKDGLVYKYGNVTNGNKKELYKEYTKAAGNALQLLSQNKENQLSAEQFYEKLGFGSMGISNDFYDKIIEKSKTTKGFDFGKYNPDNNKTLYASINSNMESYTARYTPTKHKEEIIISH
ncbi:hypothetical protein [Lachnospira multipara]|uniref:hypothetical protein n=1 Tax=Lachnospira multipara TaxID=28051 RepID=UPI00041C87CA|nr:hypothetical protein [Lachnospira multipara]